MYAASIRIKIAPSNLSSSLFLNMNALRKIRIAPTSIVIISTNVIPANESGWMSDEPPRISRMLEMFEPRIFPRASLRCF